MKKILFTCAFAIIISSCAKQAGEGGTSVVLGQVYKIFTEQNPFSGQWDTVYFMKDAGKDIYIIYSNNSQSIYDDKFETDYLGRYHFEYLRKGDYVVYTYADSTDGSGVKHDYPVFRNISITSNNSTIIVDDFVIEENQ